MKLLLLLVLSQAAPAPSAPQGAAAVPPAESPKVLAYPGTLRAGRLELAQLSKRGEHDAARDLAALLLAKPDFDAQPELERAEALYAIGLARGRAREIPEAVEHLHRATGLAGSGELGRAAAYNAATFLLQGAESLRAQIPEIREKLGLPPLEPDPAAAAPGASGAEAPDPLAVAREAYLYARKELTLALRSERLAEDVRANLELCVRRLRELDSIEREREEEQQQQQDQQDKQDQQQGENQQQDPSKDSDSKQDPQQPEDSQQQDPGERKDEPQDEPQPEPEPKDSQEAESKEAQPQGEQEERPLSPEEMQRLLQQLQQIDEKAKAVEAMLRERRRQPVKRDW